VEGDGLVGRDRELADFDRLIAAARAGHGSLILVPGVAGRAPNKASPGMPAW